jgi:hypothetical protein
MITQPTQWSRLVLGANANALRAKNLRASEGLRAGPNAGKQFAKAKCNACLRTRATCLTHIHKSQLNQCKDRHHP